MVNDKSPTQLPYIRNCLLTFKHQSLDVDSTKQIAISTRIMKVFVSLSVLVALTLAEPPRYRPSSNSEIDSTYYYFGSQEPKAEVNAQYNDQSQQQSANNEAPAPYPPSGWKPDGPSFDPAPSQQQQSDDSASAGAEVIPRYQEQYGAPAAPQQQYGAPSASQQQYGAPAASQKQQIAPATPQRQYGASSASQQQSGAPLASQQQYGAPAAPQQQYGAPVAPQKQQVAPETPQRQYGAPLASQQQYGAPTGPQQKYRGPAAVQRQERIPAVAQQQYRGPAPAQRQQGTPAESQQQYGAPLASQQQYGAPATVQKPYVPRNSVTTTEESTSTEFDESTTLPGDIEAQAEPVDSVNEFDDEGDVDGQEKMNSEYYVAFPDGRLQRVRSMSAKDIATMKYFAKITAENVEPLRGPLYAYTPPQRLQFAPASLQPALPNAFVASQNLQQSLSQPLAAPVTSSFPNYQVSSNDPKYVITF